MSEVARLLAGESFRHSWDMSDEQKINGAWIQGLCCECGEFVPFGEEIDHFVAAFAPLIRRAQADAWDEALGSCNDYSGDAPNPYANPTDHPEEVRCGGEEETDV